MKAWKLKTALPILLFALTACESANNISGSLYVAKSFSFVDKNGKAQTLTGPKSYDASLDMTAQQSTLTISTGLFARDRGS